MRPPSVGNPGLCPTMRVVLLLMWVLMPAAVCAEAATPDYESDYQAARKTYRAHHYRDAAEMLEVLLKAHPDCARCAHLLGKSYGRLAQRANWLSAMDLARKTVSAFELAVRLDPTDEGALEDLIRYYRAAPEFLGGGADKAKVMEQRLKELQAKG